MPMTFHIIFYYMRTFGKGSITLSRNGSHAQNPRQGRVWIRGRKSSVVPLCSFSSRLLFCFFVQWLPPPWPNDLFCFHHHVLHFLARIQLIWCLKTECRYAVEKDIKNNVIFVSRNCLSVHKRRRTFHVGSLKWIPGFPPNNFDDLLCKVSNNLRWIAPLLNFYE